MARSFIEVLHQSHRDTKGIIPRSAICRFTDNVLQLCFPALSEQVFRTQAQVQLFHDAQLLELRRILTNLHLPLPDSPAALATHYFDQLPTLYDALLADARAIAEGDPAAQDTDEVIRTYPGFYAIAAYRLAHCLCHLGVPRLPRIITEYAHGRTGIDIHPGAEIGPSFCIDHGTGIVIGETARIGAHVKLYQGVTLGALSVSKEMSRLKRHPTLEDHVVIYAGATVLGGSTVVGNHSLIGGNVWLTESVPPYSRVYHQPQISVRQDGDPDGVLNFSI